MGKENGVAYQILVLIVIIIIATIGVLINKLIGKNGLIDKVSVMESEYSKEDILEKINYKITQKFIDINNEAKENNKSVSELYNSDVVIEFLKENLIIQEVYDEDGNCQDGIYDINVENLRNEEDKVNEDGTFRLEKINDKYVVVYYDKENKSKEIGELQIQQMM
jgi:hypothetical protein